MPEGNLIREYIHQIKKSLRLAMNGVASTQMRKSGLIYPVNFGVAIPELKKIASRFPKSQDLADYCWNSKSREMKILSAMFQPADTFSKEMAEERMVNMPTWEVAQQYCVHVFNFVPFAEQLSREWISSEKEINRITGYMLLVRLYSGNSIKEKETDEIVIRHILKDISSPLYMLRKTSVDCIKRFGRRSNEYRKIVIRNLEHLKTSPHPEEQELFLDIEFDLNFYLNREKTDI